MVTAPQTERTAIRFGKTSIHPSEARIKSLKVEGIQQTLTIPTNGDELFTPAPRSRRRPCHRHTTPIEIRRQKRLRLPD